MEERWNLWQRERTTTVVWFHFHMDRFDINFLLEKISLVFHGLTMPWLLLHSPLMSHTPTPFHLIQVKYTRTCPKDNGMGLAVTSTSSNTPHLSLWLTIYFMDHLPPPVMYIAYKYLLVAHGGCLSIPLYKDRYVFVCFLGGMIW